MILCDSETFSADQSWLTPETKPRLQQKMISTEKEIIETALAECKGQVSGPSGAATKLALPPSTLESKIRALGINKRQFFAN